MNTKKIVRQNNITADNRVGTVLAYMNCLIEQMEKQGDSYTSFIVDSNKKLPTLCEVHDVRSRGYIIKVKCNECNKLYNSLEHGKTCNPNKIDVIVTIERYIPPPIINFNIQRVTKKQLLIFDIRY